MIDYFMVVTGQAQIFAVELFILNFNGTNLKVLSHHILLGVIIITTWCYDTNSACMSRHCALSAA